MTQPSVGSAALRRARVVLTAIAPALLVVGFDLVYEPEVVEPVGGAARYDGLSIPMLVLPAALGLAVAAIGLLLLPRLLRAQVPALASTEPDALRRRSSLTILVVQAAAWCAASMAMTVAAAWATGGVAAPQSAGLVVLGLVVGVLAVFGVGALIAAFARSAAAAALAGTAVFWPLIFIAGTFAYPPLMSDTMQRVAGFTPVGAAVQTMQHGWFGAGLPNAPGPVQLVVVGLAWALACWGVAVWRSRRA